MAYFGAMAFSRVLDLLFPTMCLECGVLTAGAQVLCPRCLAAIPLHQGLFCAVCRRPLPKGTVTCHRAALYILGCAADYRWRNVASLVKNLKFSFRRSAAVALAQLIVLYVRGLPLDFLDDPLVVPVPLGKQRRRERDFNQAAEIASCFAQQLDLSFLPTGLRRVRETLPQSSLGLAQRYRNVRDCFAAGSGAGIAGRDIIIIDDVTTSGATLFAAATAVRRAGARRVLALTAAKASAPPEHAIIEA